MLAVTTNPYVLERSFIVEVVNALANASSVRPFIGGDGVLSRPDRCSRGRYEYCALGQFGGFVMNWCAPACYEIHTMILPQAVARGRFRPGMTASP